MSSPGLNLLAGVGPPTLLNLASLDGNTIISFGVGEGNLESVSIRLVTDGELHKESGSGYELYSPRNWLTRVSTDAGDPYEVEFVIDTETGDAGTMSGSPTGAATWTAMTDTLTWTWIKDAETNGTATANCTMTIRSVASPTYTEAASFSLASNWESGA